MGVLGIIPTLCMVSVHSTNELQPGPCSDCYKSYEMLSESLLTHTCMVGLMICALPFSQDSSLRDIEMCQTSCKSTGLEEGV